MKKEIIICDICGSETNFDYCNIKLSEGASPNDVPADLYLEYNDICKNCAIKIFRFLNKDLKAKKYNGGLNFK